MATDDRVALEAEVTRLRARVAELESGDVEHGTMATVLGAVPAFIMRYDADLKIRYINRLQPGLTRDQVIGASFWDFIPEAHHEIARRAFERIHATGRPDSYSIVALGADGQLAEYETFLAPIGDGASPSGYAVVAVDVTSTRKRDRELRESEEKLRLALASTGIGLWSWWPRTGAIEWDDRMREIQGRCEPLDFPRYLAEVVHPDDRKMIADHWSGTPIAGSWDAPTHRIVRPDGTIRWVFARGVNVLAADGSIERITGGTLDVTAQRVLEEQLRHAQRLDAVGRLTAGVAHNFNNILTVITSTFDLLTRRPASEVGELIDEGRQAAQRATEMIRHLMTFAGQRPRTERGGVAVGPLVEQAVNLCRRTFERDIAIDCRIVEPLPTVACSESELDQVMMNLLLNARDAVVAAERSDPRIAVAVEHRAGRAGDLGAVHIEVRDDGIGMDAAVLGRAFDPFFTTKPVGHGTGLGLATSYAIVRELGGQLACSSEPGRGATFTVSLPASHAAPAAVRPRESITVRRTGRILLVDDEEPVRRMVSEVLVEAGYLVESAASGVEAVARLAAAPAYDVILLDRSMPGASGESFLSAIRSRAPAARVALFTGQAVEPALAQLVDAVICKPATASELVEALDGMLTP